MASPTRFEKAELVGFQGRYCIVDEISNTKLGYNIYELVDIDQDPLVSKPRFASLSTAQVDAIAGALLSVSSNTTMEQTRCRVKKFYRSSNCYNIPDD